MFPSRARAVAWGRAAAALWLSSGAVVATGCDGSARPADDGAVLVDAGMLDGTSALTLPSGAVLATPAPPAPAAPPVLGPCRTGWRSLDRPGLPSTCEPWPEPGRSACPAGEAHFPGEPGCRALGRACPLGDWPTDLPSDRMLVFAKAGARAGGTGSLTAPFATISEAVAAAVSPSLVVVAPGHYDEAVTLAAGVSLRGACARSTVISRSTRDAVAATIRVTGSGVELDDVTVGGARSGVLVDAGGDASLGAVVISHATEAGLRVHRDGHATIADLLVEDVDVDTDDRVSAFGIVVEAGGRATAARVAVTRTSPVGIVIDGAGSELVLSDAVIWDVRSTASGDFGVGIGAQGGGRAELHGVVVEDVRYVGITSGEPGTHVLGDDVVVRRVAANPLRTAASCALVNGGASLELRRVDLEQAARGVTVQSLGTLDVDHALLRAFRAEPDAPSAGDGQAIVVTDGTLRARHVRVDDAGYFGIGLFASSATLSDVTVTATRGGTAGDGGGALAAERMSRVDVTRALFEGSHAGGAHVADRARLGLVDTTIRDTSPESASGFYGRGLQVQRGGVAEVERVLVERSHAAGVLVTIDAVLRGTDLDIRDTAAGVIDAWSGSGIGLAAQQRSIVTLTRLHVARSVGWGIKVDRADTSLELTDVHVEDTAGWEREPLASSMLGRGIDAIAASVALDRAIVERSHDLGVVFVGGRAMLHDLVVRDTLGDDASRTRGGGLEVDDGAIVTATDLRIERSHETGVAVLGTGSLHAMRVEVLSTYAAACVATTCARTAGGIGVLTSFGGTIELTDFLVSRSALCGVLVSGAELDLHRGRVEWSPIGANVQDRLYDIARISDMVIYANNERNLDSAALPVPSASGAVDVVDDGM